ncbi:threonine synthase [Natrialbaceae archaeon A-chndr2]
MAETNSAVTELECYSCGSKYSLDVDVGPCRECGGILDPQYDYDSIEISRDDWEQRHGSMWKYRELLPIKDSSAIVSMGEGDTPLIECPKIAAELGVDRVYVKDEGQNPTNTFKDRGQSAAISAAKERGATDVALPSAGNAGQAASAYAARAGMNCHVYLNHQAGDLKKDLVEAHGAELHLADGKIGDAADVFAQDVETHGYSSVATFKTPFRHEGKKTMGFEVFEDLEWTTPDEIIYPTGGGVGLIGIWKAYKELQQLGWMNDEPPRMTVAQSEGVAPVVKAIEEEADKHVAWENPESIARGVEIPDPGASPWMLAAVYSSGGAGVTSSDQEAIDAALSMARTDGIEMCVTAAVALAGAFKRAEQGGFEETDEVVIINTGSGCKTAGTLGVHARNQ